MNTIPLKVGSYNVQNLFARRDLPEGHTGRPKSEWSQGALAEVLDTVDADVVALQELSSEKTLREFMANHKLNEKYPHVVHVPSHDQRGINVGFISKYPVVSYTTHVDTKFPVADGSGKEIGFSRDLLRVDLDLNGDSEADVTVYTTHSKSRRPSEHGMDSDLRRLSEGQAIRNIVESEMEEFPNRFFVVTGDFNDGTPDPSVQAVLNPADGRERWIDSLEHLPVKERQTWPANPNKSWGFDPVQLDHIIYPESQAGAVKGSEIHRLGQSKDGTYRWLSSSASDHHMISADFEIPLRQGE